ncbi:hypothetical protein PTSG_06750 [Salpingoeca rosetta]|uniref:Uncharacterized protein n=1 Tax=Salpingoeca rosetta (strain ATCC 50818 / BSB-021) TaxID=946362 RepID=F2UEP4_SALR5|nr:uncharacterized protein PTSG_06750 [Salpingoeca rosetta]EGD75094.1 hypothetical protein PTSG_06750 [Salpingoeca rosetta]|eukprot:XP_004992147.1 hypothetical protein PTSG_06750 [Salpingoeca rosetta]
MDRLRQSTAPCGPQRPHRYGHVEAEHSTMRPTTATRYGHVEAEHSTMRPTTATPAKHSSMRPTTSTPMWTRWGKAEHHAAHNAHPGMDTLGQSRTPCGPQRPRPYGHVEAEQNTMRPTTTTPSQKHHAAHNGHTDVDTLKQSSMRPTTATPGRAPCGPQGPHGCRHVEAEHHAAHNVHTDVDTHVEAEHHAAHNVHTDVDTLRQSTMRPTTTTPV